MSKLNTTPICCEKFKHYLLLTNTNDKKITVYMRNFTFKSKVVSKLKKI